MYLLGVETCREAERVEYGVEVVMADVYFQAVVCLRVISVGRYYTVVGRWSVRSRGMVIANRAHQDEREWQTLSALFSFSSQPISLSLPLLRAGWAASQFRSQELFK